MPVIPWQDTKQHKKLAEQLEAKNEHYARELKVAESNQRQLHHTIDELQTQLKLTSQGLASAQTNLTADLERDVTQLRVRHVPGEMFFTHEPCWSLFF